MSQKRYKIRLSALIALAILLCCVVSVGIQAIPPCEQVVKRVITKVEPRHFSRATVARWMQWGKQHPNYHAPKRTPRVTTQEVQDMVTFACAMPSVETEPALAYLDNEALPEKLGFVEQDSRPYTVESEQYSNTPALLAMAAPAPDATAGEAPEPQSWLFLTTGLAFLALVLRAHRSASSFASNVS